MKRILISLALGLVVLLPLKANALSLNKVDCKSPSSYVAHNLTTITHIASFAMNVIQDADILTAPTAYNGALGMKSIGGLLQISKLYTAGYVSPEAALNSVLGLVCIELTF